MEERKEKNYYPEARKLFTSYEKYRVVYNKWNDMIKRCYNPKSCNYKYYGARGIRVCEEWLGKEGFYNFCKWILSVGYDENKSGRYQSLDKINNDGNYEPSNCRLATPSIQNGNMRTKTQTGYKGVRKHTVGNVFYTTVKVNGVVFHIGDSKSKNECARMRNDFIIKNNLPKPLNIIKPELEEILPTKIRIYRCYNKENILLYEERNIKYLAKLLNITSQFIGQCLSGKRNSKLYNFEKEEKIVYEY